MLAVVAVPHVQTLLELDIALSEKMFLALNLSTTKFSRNVFFVSQKLFLYMPAGGAIMSEPTFSPKKTNASTDDSGDDDDGESITKNKGELSSATGHATCQDGTTDKSPWSCEM